jgi:hypothetical protein
VLFIDGPGEDYGSWSGIAICSVNRDRDRIVHHSTFDTYGEPYKMEIIMDSLLVFSHYKGLTIAEITSEPDLELYAKYHTESINSCLDFCVKDSFIFTATWQVFSEVDSRLVIQTFKFNTDSLDQCSYNYNPNEFEFETYPNPFNSECQISFSLNNSKAPEIDIYNINGEKVADFSITQNSSSIKWDASSEASGVYLVVLNDGDRKVTKKIVLMK